MGFRFSVFFLAAEDRRLWYKNGLNSDESAGAIVRGEFLGPRACRKHVCRVAVDLCSVRDPMKLVYRR